MAQYADLPVGSYFLTPVHLTAARLPMGCLKAREEDGRVRCTRMHDAVYIDGWAETGQLGELTPCSAEQARAAALAVRRAYG